jgi:hypothetical protein
MKKSSSTPCFLTSSSSINTITLYSSTNSLKSLTSSIKRNISTNALSSLDIPILKDEIEYVAMHYPINKFITCNSQYISPILNMNAPSKSIDDIDDEIKNLGSCLAEPCEANYEAEETNCSRYYWLEKAMTCEKTRKRYKVIYSKIKKVNNK